MPRQQAIEALIAEMQKFIREVNGAASVCELKQPVIKKEDYTNAIQLMSEFAVNDIAHLASYRPLKLNNYKQMFEAAWDSKKIVY